MSNQEEIQEEKQVETPEKKKRNRQVYSKKWIIDIMQKKHLRDRGLSNRLVLEVVEAFIETYKEAILTHKRVELPGFGTIRREFMKGRLLVHPKFKGEAIVSPYYRISFRPTKDFKLALKELAIEEVKKNEVEL